MTTYAADVLFVLLVALATALPTGLFAADRGWFPGGKEKPDPNPEPQPEEGK